MDDIKRKLCLIITFLIIISFLPVMTYADVKLDKNVALLNDLGICGFNDMNLDESIKRSELAYLAAAIRMGGDGNVEVENNTYFDDVNTATIYNEYISYAYEMGLMNGIGGGRFNPDGTVSTQDIERVMMRTLGYSSDYISESEYQMLVSGFKMFKGVYLEDAKAITKKAAVDVAVNTLKCNMFRFDGSIGTGFVYDSDDNIILSRIFGLYRINGLFYSGRTLGKNINSVMVDSKMYELEYSDEFDGKDGYNVVAYLKKGTEDIIFIDFDYFKNKEYVIEADDIVSISGNKITYYNENGNKAVQNLNGMNIIYNGIMESSLPNNLVVDDGNVVLVGTDDGYTTAIINSYETMVVGAVIEETVYDYYNSTFSHKFSKGSNLDIILNGEKIDISELKKGDVLSIGYSRDNKYCTVYVSRTTVSGTVTEIVDEYFVINRKEIYRSEYFVKNATDPKLGSTVKLAMDYFGRVAANLEQSSAESEYKYMIYAGSDGGLMGSPLIKLYDENNGVHILPLAKNVIINGYSVKSSSINNNGPFKAALYTKFNVDSNGIITEQVMNDFVSQMIKCKQNSDGEVYFIDTAIRTDKEDDSSLKLAGVFDASYLGGPSQIRFSYIVNNDDMTGFYVPDKMLNDFDASGNLPNGKLGIDDTMFMPALNVLSHGTKLSGYAYDVTDGGAARAFVFNNPDAAGKPTGGIDSEDDIFVVDKVSLAINKAGDESYKVSGYVGGKYLSYGVAYPKWFIKSENDSSSVPVRGDILQISLNVHNEISAFVTRYDSAGTGYSSNGYEGGPCELIDGICYSFDETGIIVSDSLSNINKVKIFSLKNMLGRFYVVDYENRKVRMGELADLIAYKDAGDIASKLAVRVNYGAPAELVLYK